jgi:hypothetical protein
MRLALLRTRCMQKTNGCSRETGMMTNALEKPPSREPVFGAQQVSDSFFSSIGQYTSYSDLVRRMSRVSAAPRPIEYEFTTDPGYIHQYCILREEMFKKVWDLSHFSAQKDEIDDNSHILVARQGLHCVGGGRLTLTAPNHRRRLPMEGGDFNLLDAMPQFDLAGKSYAEITRIAVLSEYSKDNVIAELIDRLILKIMEEGGEYLFLISPASMTRNHRRVGATLGYSLITDYSVKIPEREEYEGIKMYLSYLDLKLYRHRLDDKAPAKQRVVIEETVEA